MISCAFCLSQVEDDFFFCDQCGKEIMICNECGRTGQGKCCDEDGSDLVSAKTRAEKFSTSGSNPRQTVIPSPTQNANQAIPGLRLVNANRGIMMNITSGEIMGRSSGMHAVKLAGFPAISGKHLVFTYDMLKGWTFRDIGSSNGTKYNTNNRDWQNIANTIPETIVPIQNKGYILIANVEFVIEIDIQSNTGTQRL